MAPNYWLVLPAAGKGERMHPDGTSLPKQYREIAGRTVLEHALAPFIADPACVGLVVALAPGDARFGGLRVSREGRLSTVTGGETRADSVRAGLEEVRRRAGDQDPWVLVHDAARPCLPSGDLAKLLAALEDSPDGALLALPIADTVKRADATGFSHETVPREGLWRAATPQAFRLRTLLAAVAKSPGASDEAGAIEAMGGRPRLVAGSSANLKLTTPGDLALTACLLEGRAP